MDHVTDLLGAYLDGELRASQMAKIDKHIENCDLCRSELQELTKLSHLLQEFSEVPKLKSQDQFVAEVGLMMERQPEPTMLKRVAVTGWKAIPVGLACSWLFIQTSSITTTLLTGLTRVAPGLPVIHQLTPVSVPSDWSNALESITQPLFVQILEFIIKRLDLAIPVNWQIPELTLLPILIGVLYACWLASWWAIRESKLYRDKV